MAEVILSQQIFPPRMLGAFDSVTPPPPPQKKRKKKEITHLPPMIRAGLF